jgi:hypothetical protein
MKFPSRHEFLYTCNLADRFLAFPIVNAFKFGWKYPKTALIVCAASLPMLGVQGCSSTSQLTPTAEADIVDAYQVLCGPSAPTTISGIVGIASASSSALPATAQSAITTATAICAAGVPDNEVVAGVDIFQILVEVEQLVPSKVAASTKAKVHRLASRHHVA